MTDAMTRRDLHDLIVQRHRYAVSIYMPTARAGKRVRQNPIRFKNLLRRAEKKLQDSGVRTTEIKQLLRPGFALIDDALFWRNQSDGFVAYFSPDRCRHYRLPYRFKPTVTVSSRFFIQPILSYFSEGGKYYVLELSKKRVRLLEGTRVALREIQLRDVPTSLADITKYDDPERQVQFHTGTPARPQRGKRSAVFHGQGVGTDGRKHKKKILEFLRRIDKGLYTFLEHERAPLILVGVDYILDMYRDINQYEHVFDETITGNPERMKERDIHKETWRIVKPFFLETKRRSLENYRQLAHTEQTTDDITRIVPAAYNGHVVCLFAARRRHFWGQFNPEDSKVSFTDKPMIRSYDLLDFAVVHTLLHRGIVYVLEQRKMPTSSAIAAILRF